MSANIPKEAWPESFRPFESNVSPEERAEWERLWVEREAESSAGGKIATEAPHPLTRRLLLFPH
jgi:hypothetical protein